MAAAPAQPARLGSLWRGLALACHPIPTLAVTAISAGLAALAKDGWTRGILVVLAIFAGQLSIGWSNDSIDAARDRAAQRSDKPIARGELSPTSVRNAAIVAALVTVVLSFTLGYRAGIASLVIVVCGWLYNLGLKATVWSWLPYAIAFGTLPAVATLALPAHRWPAAWAMVAGGLLGVCAHFGNVLPDLVEDARAGVRGLPHRLGRRPSVVAGPVLLLTATAVIVFGGGKHGGHGGRSSGGGVSLSHWLVFVVAALAAVAAVILGLRRPLGRAFFLSTVVVAVLDVVLFALSGGRLY